MSTKQTTSDTSLPGHAMFTKEQMDQSEFIMKSGLVYIRMLNEPNLEISAALQILVNLLMLYSGHPPSQHHELYEIEKDNIENYITATLDRLNSYNSPKP